MPFFLLLATMNFLGSALNTGSIPPSQASRAPGSPAGRDIWHASLPLSFELNQGQTDPQVRFLTHGSGYSLFLTADEAVLTMQRTAARTGSQLAVTPPPTVVRLKLLRADPHAGITGEEQLPGKSNYFIGNDPQRWHRDVPTYARVRYHAPYPGIDVVYYGQQGNLEYDFVVRPGADPHQVRFGIEGATKIRLNNAGELVLQTHGGEVVLRRPRAYQTDGRREHPVASRYVFRGKTEIAFDLGAYRRDKPLIIDPVLTYSTYLGGSGGDMAAGIKVDSAGNAYVVGMTASTNFPIKSAVQLSGDPEGDAFVAKLNPTGSGLIYSTYIGGSRTDSAAAIAIDSLGNAYVVGTTSSVDFPVTAGAFQRIGGGNGSSDAFVLKLDPSGSAFSYASYLGGSGADFGQAIAIDASGNAYVTGSTQSPDFPTLNPLQIGNDGCSFSNNVETCSVDAFVAELNAAGSNVIYSTFLGGSGADSGQAIVVDAQGNAYVAGYTFSSDFPTQNAMQGSSGSGADAFVAELSAGGTSLIFSTYFGGNGQDQAFGMVLDASGSIYIAGAAGSTNFPVTSNVFQTSYGGNGDAFVSKLSPGATSLVYSTLIGGSGADQANALAVDSSGNVVVVGFTASSDFPTVDPLQRVAAVSGAGSCGSNPCSDAFVTKLNPSGMPAYSTYLGGTGADFAQAVALDSSEVPYVAGSTSSTNFPAIVGALQAVYSGVGLSGNAFIAKIDPNDAPGVALNPQDVNFGNQTLNVTSTAQTVNLVNAGSAPLEITSITASGEYAASNDCGTTVPAGGGTCTVSITFTPTAAGLSTEQVTIGDNAAGSPHRIGVTGSGVTGNGAALTLAPASLVFPTQAIGSTSPPQLVQLVNGSQSAITLTSIAISGDFAQTSTCGVQPTVLNAGASCTVSVTFTPTASGSRTGSLTIADNAATTSQSASLTGTGGGAPFTLSVANRSNVIVAGTTSTTFTISASAPSSFVSSITLSCSSTATCAFNPVSIAPGQSSTLTVSGLSATTSNPLNITVTGTSGTNKATVSMSIFLANFTVSATPSLDAISAGAPATYTVTVTPLNGFNQVVLLGCGTSLPNLTTCSWSPPGLTLNGSTPSTSTLTVTTTTQKSAHGWFRLRSPGNGPKPEAGFWILAAALLGLLFAGSRLTSLSGRFPQRARWALAFLGIFLLGMAGTSCNQYNGFNVLSAAPPVGTPSGNYVITVVAELGSNANVTQSTTVNLSVGPG